MYVVHIMYGNEYSVHVHDFLCLHGNFATLHTVLGLSLLHGESVVLRAHALTQGAAYRVRKVTAGQLYL